MTIRILVAGFQHETNTFSPTKADYANFERGGGFPMMCRGAGMFELLEVNIPAGGFLRAARQNGWEVTPVIWAGASPSAHVTNEAFERIASEITNAAAAGGFDAIYLDLHGAMVTEAHDDGEGVLLQRVRELVGPRIPIVASLDLHANVTQAMLSHANALVAYRTYPHVDLIETGERAFSLVRSLLEKPGRRALHIRRIPFLIPVNSMCTYVEPARSIYELLESLEQQQGIDSISFCPGFPAADFPECGPVLWAHGSEAELVQQVVEQLYAKVVDQESAWRCQLLTPDEAVTQALRLSQGANRPVIIADTQDNPGAGGDSNTMGMLRALLSHRVQNAAIGLIWDPAAVQAALAAGQGASISIALGGSSGVKDDAPLDAVFEVLALSDGVVRYDGPMMHGMRAQLGPVACLRIDGVDVVVSSHKAQMFDRNLYRMAGVQPEQKTIIVNKSSVHFRADFQPIAQAVLVAKSPGPMAADPQDLPWQRLDDDIRLAPCGPTLRQRRSMDV